MSDRPRILFAGLFHETHTFLERVTGWNDFQVRRGDSMIATKGDSSPMGGALEAAAELSWDVVPALHVHAMPLGHIDGVQHVLIAEILVQVAEHPVVHMVGTERQEATSRSLEGHHELVGKRVAMFVEPGRPLDL